VSDGGQVSGVGWWRRNRWGLIALVPALAAALAVNVYEAYESYWKTQPRDSVVASDDEWVAFAGARLRLVELVPADDLKDSNRNVVTPPEGVAVWRVRIAIDAAQPESLAGCELLLEDDAGRTYEDAPRDLAMVSLLDALCTPDTTGLETSSPGAPTPSTFENVTYFATPSAARPVAVRVTLSGLLPAYARLTTR
jgi:hypothetical protein